MFEYAIEQQRSHPPSKRFFAALALSCLSHFLAVLILIEYPQLLGRGLNTWLRRPVFFTTRMVREPSWRTVAVLGKGGRMSMPPADVLKKNIYDFEAHREGAPAPPIRIKWGGEIADDGKGAIKPAPAVKPVMGTQEPRTAPEVADAGKQEATPSNPPSAVAAGTPQGSGETAAGRVVPLPPPQTPSEPRSMPRKPAAETTGMVSPGAIPNAAGAAAANLPKSSGSAQSGTAAPQVFENEQKAIRSEGSGLFGGMGFPLGEYATLIKERIEGNWFIPSNLRKSQGRTTVIFYIEKDGRYTGAHIVAPSGNSSLDLAALNAIIGSNPFPPLPKGFPGDRIGAKFVFSYNEHQ